MSSIWYISSVCATLIASTFAMSSPMCSEQVGNKRLCGSDHSLLRDWNNAQCQCGNRHGIELQCVRDPLLGKQVCDETPVSAWAPVCNEISNTAGRLVLCGRSHPIPVGHRECRCQTGYVCIPELSSAFWTCNTVSECERMGMDPCDE